MTQVGSILTEVAGVVCGGGLGALCMQLYNAGVNRRKLKAEAEAAQEDAEKRKLENRHDAFDTLYQQLSKCMSDYTAISEEYRQYVEKARKSEEAIQRQIHDKCMELAEIKSKLLYFKGIRCYNMTCEYRIKNNPEGASAVDVREEETIKDE